MKTMNMFIHFHSSLEYHTQFQTKMSKVYAHLPTETAPNSKPFEAAHTCKAYTCMREVPTGVRSVMDQHNSEKLVYWKDHDINF